MTTAMVKLFNDPAVAVNAIRELLSRGVQVGDIGVAVKSDEAAEMISRRAEMALTAKGDLSLAGPDSSCDSLDGLADMWGVPKQTLFYYESGLRRGGVVISVHVDEAKAGEAKATLRNVDPFHIVPVDPPVNDRPFFLSERTTKSDARDRLFSGDFRKY